MPRQVPAAAVWALGATQIVGYGTLYYGFSALAPAIGAEFGWPPEWVFGALSLALLAGGLLAPVAGHLADRFGAARIMAIGSLLAALTLVGAALAPSGPLFAPALVAMEIASTLVLYTAAFAALVQLGGRGAQSSITHLTLIAGFASTLFWPLSAWLEAAFGWRGAYLAFAALNLGLAAPLHLWLMALTRRREAAPAAAALPADDGRGLLPAGRGGLAFGLLLAGFALEGFILSGVLLHLPPLLDALQLGPAALLVTTLFGPAQVLSRLVNMVFGRGLSQAVLGIVAAVLPPVGLALLAGFSPAIVGALVFAIVFGLGSGLTSIVSGSLPLELFGRVRYGARLGWMSSARQVASAIAPFGLALLMGGLGIAPALWLVVGLGALSTAIFVSVALLARAGPAPAPQPAR